MSPYASLVIGASLRNRRRTALTVASVAVSLCLLGVLMALYRALFFGGDPTPGQAKRLVVHSGISLTQDLPVAYEEVISGLAGVRAVTRLRWFGGTYKDLKNQFAQFAIEPRTLFVVYPEFTIPESERRAFITERTACVASRALANRLGWKVGQRIPLAGNLMPVNLELTLVGVLDDPANSEALFFNWDYLRESLPEDDDRRDMAQQFYVETGTTADVASVASQVDRYFTNSPSPTRTEPEQAFLLSFASFLGNVKLFLAVMAGAVSLMIVLVVANTLSMSVREQTREVGILKTLGFSPGQVVGIVVGEAGVMVVAGGLLGSVLAQGLCAAIGSALRSAPGPLAAIGAVGPSPLIAGLTIAASLAIGLAGSALPALSAARTSILDALRYSG